MLYWMRCKDKIGGKLYAKQEILENIMFVQEALHFSIHRGDKGMTIKLDMANAFDRVGHSFLYEVMYKFGFL